MWRAQKTLPQWQGNAVIGSLLLQSSNSHFLEGVLLWLWFATRMWNKQNSLLHDMHILTATALHFSSWHWLFLGIFSLSSKFSFPLSLLLLWSIEDIRLIWMKGRRGLTVSTSYCHIFSYGCGPFYLVHVKSFFFTRCKFIFVTCTQYFQWLFSECRLCFLLLAENNKVRALIGQCKTNLTGLCLHCNESLIRTDQTTNNILWSSGWKWKTYTISSRSVAFIS